MSAWLRRKILGWLHPDTQIHVHVHGTVMTEADLAREVRAALLRRGPRQTGGLG